MSIYAIDHVQLAMPAGEEDRARRFFGCVLGMTEVPKPAALASRGGVWFEAGSVQLHMGVERDFRPARKAHPAFLVDDLDDMLNRVRANGNSVSTDEPPIEGYRRAHIEDVFGNRIELMARVG
ncbi:MAG: glyoxalase [Phycisphaerae bacterium]|jgi:predicted enzyme related to lactoylglutathione lyase|nr:glyoxalase [Phycisphaerae bacterium]